MRSEKRTMTNGEARNTARAMLAVALAGAALLWAVAASAEFRERYDYLRTEAHETLARAAALAWQGRGMTIAERLAVWSKEELSAENPTTAAAR